jgi:hypothetical protein
MKLDTQKFNCIVKEAKATDKRWLRAIERAAEGILRGELIVTMLCGGALFTSPNGSYHTNGARQYHAFARGHKERRHRAAARLIELHETAPAAVPHAEERSAMIADIGTIWPRACPHLPLATELMARFGKNKLEMLDDDMPRRVRIAIAL